MSKNVSTWTLSAVAAVVWLTGCSTSISSEGEAPRLFNLKVVTNAVPDMTSVDALLADVVKPGMSDRRKCTAAFEAVYHFRFWSPSSRPDIRGRYGGVDPILNLNCFPPTICQQDAEMCVALWNQLGHDGRVWQLGGHTTSEVYWGGRWRHFDATNGTISKDDKGNVVGVAERHNWPGRKKLIKPTSYVSYSDGYVLGHRMEMTLRRGETFTRYWRPTGKTGDYYVPSVIGGRPRDRSSRRGRRMARSMRLRARQFELPPIDAAYANGVWVFEPDLGGPDWAAAFEGRRNVAVAVPAGGAYLHPREAGKDAWIVCRLRSPYIMTGGWLSAKLTSARAKDRVSVEASSDNGCSWRRLWAKAGKGAEDVRIPLREGVNGELDCLVRINMRSAGRAADVRLEHLRLETIVQSNPFALPALGLGKTTVSVSAGEQLDRLTLLPKLNSPDYRKQIVEAKNVCTAREDPRMPKWVSGLCATKPDTESYVVFKLEAPGEIRRLRWGGRFFRGNDLNKLYYSFDGKNWTEKKWTYRQAPKVTRNERRSSVVDYETLETVPAGTKTMWLKYWFLRKGPIKDPAKRHLATQLRADADYVPPARGRRPPVEITYCWTERHGKKDVEKTHTKVVKSYPARYTVTVRGDRQPTMKSVEVRLAGAR